MNNDELCEEVLISLRRIVRAVDLQSRQLVRLYGLTGPQMLLLKELIRRKEATVGQLAESISLSMPTVTDILNRLEKRGLIQRTRSKMDKRCILVKVTNAAKKKLIASSPLLQEEFVHQFSVLQQWEQLQLISGLNRIAEMMNAKELDASPVLSSGPLATPETVPDISTQISSFENVKPGSPGENTA